MSASRQAAPDDHAGLVRWIEEFGGHVHRCEFEPAAQQFDDAIVSFSSRRDIVVGIDELAEEQWKHVWPSITGFRFESETMRTFLSPDGLQAAVAVTWSSTGYHEDGTTFDRPGRATIVLARETVASSWRAIHAHFSLHRGVPQQSFGRPAD